MNLGSEKIDKRFYYIKTTTRHLQKQMNTFSRMLIVLAVCFFFANTTFVMGQSQEQKTESTEFVSVSVSNDETAVSAPAAVPILSIEDAEQHNNEAIRIKDEELSKRTSTLQHLDYLRKKDHTLFLIRMSFSICGVISLLFLVSFITKKKLPKGKDLSKIVISPICSIMILFLVHSVIPYFYNFWSIGNLCFGAGLLYLIFKYYERIFFFRKKDVLFLPLLLLGTLFLICIASPRVRDTPNTIVLFSDSDGQLTYNGTIATKKIRAKNDFMANYNIISFEDGWKQEGSYRASIKKGKGKLVLYLPSDLIQKYKLNIKLTAFTDDASGTIIVNGQEEIPWKLEKASTKLLPLQSSFLYPSQKKCPILFLIFSTVGAFCVVFLLMRLFESLIPLYYTNRTVFLELALFIVCVIFLVANLKNSFFIDNCNDLDEMAANHPKRFYTKHPPMIYAWWLFARLISPFESINTAFVFGVLLSFWGGMWFLGSYLIRQKQPLFAFLIILPCVNLISASIFTNVLLVDQIVFSTCVLTFGLCTRISTATNIKKTLLSIIIAILIMVVATIRLEGLLYAIPLSIVFSSLTFFSKHNGFKRILLSSLVGCILLLSLSSFYKLIISPYVFHARKVDASKSAVDSLFIESLGICYFNKDWNDLPEFFSEEAKEALDRTQFIERTRPFTSKYLPDAKAEDVQEFWIHMIKKYPLTYLHIKWISNQVLWRLRPSFEVPYDVNKNLAPSKTGLSVEDFFRDGITSFGLVLPSWVPQLSLLFVFLFVGILLFKFSDSGLWIIWGIGASGFLHNLAFFLVAGGTNYRYIYWADMSGRISFFLSILVIIKLLEYKQKKDKGMINSNNNQTKADTHETLCPNPLFQ